MKLKNKEYNDKIDTLVITLTRDCNLNCSYCFVKKKREKVSLKKVKSTLDLFLKNSKSQKTIIYFGGEPFLEKELIRKIIEYTNKKEYNIKHKIITNGTLLDKEFIQFLKKNNIGIGISLDGVQESNNKNRKFIKNKEGSYFSIIDNIKYIKPDAIMYLISKNRINELVTDIKWLEKISPILKIDFERWVGWSNKEVDLLKEKVEETAKYIRKNKNTKIITPNFIGCRKNQVCLFTDGEYYDCTDLPYIIKNNKLKSVKKGEFNIKTNFEDVTICLHYNKQLGILSKSEINNNYKIIEIIKKLRK